MTGTSPEVPSVSVEGVELRAPVGERGAQILADDALEFVAGLHRRFNSPREDLLQARVARQERIAAGEVPDLLPDTREVRECDWQVAPV
jgi:malate synthase